MGVGGETLCCEWERALSVQMDAGRIPRKRKVRCSKMYATVHRCHCRLSQVSLLTNAESLLARALDKICLALALSEHRGPQNE